MNVNDKSVLGPPLTCEPEPADATQRASTNAATVTASVAGAIAQQVGTAATATRNDANALERAKARENDADAGGVGTVLERTYRAVLQQMPVGAKSSLQLDGDLKLGASVGIRNKVDVLRAADDRYEVTVAAGGSLGAGLGAAFADAKLSNGMEGRITMVFRSAEEAADKLSALTQTAARIGAEAGGAPLIGQGIGYLSDADATGRSLSAFRNVNRLQFEVSTGAQLGQGGKVVSIGAPGPEAKVEAAGKMSWAIDLEQRTVIQEQALELKHSAHMGGFHLGRQAEEMSGNLKLRNRWTLPEADVARLRTGELTVGGLLGRLVDGHQSSIVATFSGTISHVKLTFEREVPYDLQLLRKPELLMDPAHADWDFSSTLQTKQKVGIDVVKGLKASLTVSEERPLRTARGTIQREVDAVREGEAERVQLTDQLVVHRALANRP